MRDFIIKSGLIQFLCHKSEAAHWQVSATIREKVGRQPKQAPTGEMEELREER